MALHIKRIHEPPAASDGLRILVDRLWPRGFTKERAHVDEWNKQVSPSAELRQAFHGGSMDFAGFTKAYLRELRGIPEELDRLRELARTRKVTLLYASADTEHNHARLLLKELQQ